MSSIIISTPAGDMRLSSNGNALSEARFIEADISSNPRPHPSVTITDGTLGGYSAGLLRKSYLLNLEKSHLS